MTISVKFEALDEAFAALGERARQKAGQITLGHLLDLLGPIPSDCPVLLGKDQHPLSLSWSRPISYRGYDSDLALDPCRVKPGEDTFGSGDSSITVDEADLLTVEGLHRMLSDVLGTDLEGYKGGEFTMTRSTLAWVASHGWHGRMITGVTLAGVAPNDYLVIDTKEPPE